MKTIAYNTSKGAVINFTKTLAVEWGHHGITVNAHVPRFLSDQDGEGPHGSDGSGVAAFRSQRPFRRP